MSLVVSVDVNHAVYLITLCVRVLLLLLSAAGDLAISLLSTGAKATGVRANIP